MTVYFSLSNLRRQLTEIMFIDLWLRNKQQPKILTKNPEAKGNKRTYLQ